MFWNAQTLPAANPVGLGKSNYASPKQYLYKIPNLPIHPKADAGSGLTHSV